MEDVKFTRSHSNSPLPEAGNDPSDPVRPEIDEENSTPNPPIADPYKDMEVVDEQEKVEVAEPQDSEQGGLSDNESELSEIDDAQFDDFDVDQIAVEERPQIIDDTNLNLIGVHKRKRAEGEGDAPKKKKKKADRPRRKKRDEEGGVGDDLGARKSKRSHKEGRVKGASPDVEDESLTPDEREYISPTSLAVL